MMTSKSGNVGFGLNKGRRTRILRGRIADLRIGLGRKFDGVQDYALSLHSKPFGEFLVSSSDELSGISGIKRMKFDLSKGHSVAFAAITISCAGSTSFRDVTAPNRQTNKIGECLQISGIDIVSVADLKLFVDGLQMHLDSAESLFQLVKKGGVISKNFVLFDAVRTTVFLGIAGGIPPTEIMVQTLEHCPELNADELLAFIEKHNANSA
ncbi:hypothetical protein [Hyphomonas sp. KY3]|uniref:hypothetical protein n=1 Tax=Hyphomonas sp. KY3 TaxID=2016196 RepID=UPI001A8D6CFE|nr:hypothetical protein [Hyphomonas sp. KY3]QSR23082.1 hypothetical protein CFA77_12345 [Hyphomonas sp. KY3]